MNDFFGKQYGNKLQADNAQDLIYKLSKVNTNVPGRLDGRTSSDRERYCIVLYLIQLANNGLLEYPISIEKSESPDIILQYESDLTIGIEHSDIGNEKTQADATALEQFDKKAILVDSVDENGEIVPIMSSIDNGISSEGIEGDIYERSWVKFLSEGIKKKNVLLNKSHFKQLNLYWLILYDLTGIIVLNIDKALKIFKDNVNRGQDWEELPRQFSMISVMSDNNIFYDIMRDTRIFNLSDKEGV